MRGFLFEAVILAVCLLQIFSLEAGFKTCELIGLSSFRSFERNVSESYMLFNDCGEDVLLSNKWIKVFHRVNKTNRMLADTNRRLYVLFYDGQSSAPVSFGTDAAVFCLDDDCSHDCTITPLIDGIGVKKSVKTNLKYDAKNGHVIYYYHKDAGITLYIRKNMRGFSFGIRVPEELINDSHGLCITSSSIKYSFKPQGYYDNENAKKVCEKIFDGLTVEKFRFDACLQDINRLRNVSYLNDQRLAYFDLKLIRDYMSINDKYNNISMPSFSSLR